MNWSNFKVQALTFNPIENFQGGWHQEEVKWWSDYDVMLWLSDDRKLCTCEKLTCRVWVEPPP